MDSMHGMQMSARAPHEDGKWMQFLSEDAFNATNNPFFMNPPSSSSFPCLPSKVVPKKWQKCKYFQHST